MKTTMEIPDELYRRAKTRAAAENRKVRDLVTEGLTVVLERGGAGTELNETSEQVLNALDEILRSPASPAGRVQELQEEARRIQEDGWSRDESLA
jgi:hypothetical protein